MDGYDRGAPDLPSNSKVSSPKIYINYSKSEAVSMSPEVEVDINIDGWTFEASDD